MCGFDLKAIHSIPSVGELKHNANVESLVNLTEKGKKGEQADDDLGSSLRVIDPADKLTISLRDSIVSARPLQESFADRNSVVRKSLSGKVSVHERDLPRGSRFDDDDQDAVASIVTGDSHHSSLRLDDVYYHGHGQKRLHAAPRAPLVELDLNDDSHQSLQTKLVSHGQADQVRAAQDNTILTHNAPRAAASQDMRTAPKTSVVVMNGSAAYARDLTRGARSRLSRLGFEGALQDTPLPASLAPHAASGAGLGSGGVIDLLAEASDPLALHEVTVQFAGVKFGSLVPGSRGRTGSAAASFYDAHCPKRVYFSYQFYTCMPTRTEILRLVT
eukprot:gene28338-37399_t